MLGFCRSLCLAFVFLLALSAGAQAAETGKLPPIDPKVKAEMKALQAKIKTDRDYLKAERERLKPVVERLKANNAKMKAMREKIKAQREALHISPAAPAPGEEDPFDDIIPAQ